MLAAPGASCSEVRRVRLELHRGGLLLDSRCPADNLPADIWNGDQAGRRFRHHPTVFLSTLPEVGSQIRAEDPVEQVVEALVFQASVLGDVDANLLADFGRELQGGFSTLQRPKTRSVNFPLAGTSGQDSCVYLGGSQAVVM